VDDLTCAIFFPALYSALLPGHRTTGIRLSDAIRAGAATLSRLPRGTTADAFMLFGDPSLNLRITFGSGKRDRRSKVR
jgi:hypothetical protein